MAPPSDAQDRRPYTDELGPGRMLILGCKFVLVNLELHFSLYSYTYTLLILSY